MTAAPTGHNKTSMATFSAETWIRGTQCGPGGLLQPSRYFELINLVVEEWFEQGLALSFAELHFQHRIGIPTGQLAFRLHGPIALDERVRLQLTVMQVGNRTIELHIVCSGDDAPRFEAEAVLVMVDLSAPTLKSYAIPPPLRAQLEAYGP